MNQVSVFRLGADLTLRSEKERRRAALTRTAAIRQCNQNICRRAPIALIVAADCQRHFWESHCGLPDDQLLTAENECNLSVCRGIELPTSGLVIADIANDGRFALDPLLQQLKVRFFAGAPLRTHENETLGLLCVLDTRPREIGDEQKDLLLSIADAVVKAIELHSREESEESHSDSPVAESSLLAPTNR